MLSHLSKFGNPGGKEESKESVSLLEDYVVILQKVANKEAGSVLTQINPRLVEALHSILSMTQDAELTAKSGLRSQSKQDLLFLA
jgi:hypothetical protein